METRTTFEVDDRALQEAAPLTAEDLVPDRSLTRATEDRFRHAALARRVSQLVTSVEPPTSVALFGPWGSGKSSLAGLIREQLRGGHVGFVYYDAWRFGGKALRRNFISNAADQLKIPRNDEKFEKYYEGLYQSRRRARFHPKSVRRAVFALGGAFAIFLLILVLLLVGALAVASTFTDRDAVGEIKHGLPLYLGPGGGLALLVAVVTAALAAGRVDVDQSAPSDEEEFSHRFRDLIEDVRDKDSPTKDFRPRYERVVFFIDELDRCDEKDVVQTLVAIRTFLGEQHCVFVVAADRDVLETALKREVEQATPTDTVDPYYATAGAFLDKIFGHQIEVPPIRGRRLTRFARDLVREKGGLWGEIVEHGGQAALDSVIYTLVPAHVRSPRRIKVLLNNFATNARVAESRGIAWPARATEIAKLIALQTEFPSVARDLVFEPRLPRFLLDPDDDDISDRSRSIVNRHRVDEAAPSNEAEDPDRFLDDDDERDKTGHEEMRKRYRAQLQRYLERTAGVDNPQRDLLYLEAAGAAVDLADPELGELIEELAPENPAEVISELQQRAKQEQVAAVRLLADMVEDTIAREQANVMTTMMQLTSGLGQELSDRAAEDVANSLRLFSREKAFEPDHLVGALSVALRVGDDVLASRVGSRDDLWNDNGRLRGVALMLPVLPAALKASLGAHIAASVATEPTLLGDSVAALPEPYAVELLQMQEIHDEVERYLADSTVGTDERQALAEQLLGASLR